MVAPAIIISSHCARATKQSFKERRILPRSDIAVLVTAREHHGHAAASSDAVHALG